jgi:hypothetical protein
MVHRAKLPDRRNATVIDFDYGGVSYVTYFGCGVDGTLAEIFLNAGKEGSAADIIGRECAVSISIALQYGVPLAVLMEALPKLANSEPAGPVGIALKAFTLIPPS